MQSSSNKQQSTPPPAATHTSTSPLKSQTSTKPTRKSPLAQTVARDCEPSERPSKRARLDWIPAPLTAAAAGMPPQPQPRPRSRPTPPATQTSPNPAVQVLNSLSALSNEMSKAPTPSEAPAASTVASAIPEPTQVITENMQQPQAAGSESQTQTSPVSLSSIGTVGSVPSIAPVSGIDTSTVNSPSPMDERQDGQAADSKSPESRHVAFSYPGIPAHISNEARRGMSLPNSGQRQGTRSPSTKKHRCPYCATEFTRHHNLKSHLLTHSQEKPYVCSTCQSRFRRLHDLKRHTKLHTGERPHICPKCGRKFARGDALARHNKGPGGCAGRRASMGGFNSDEEFEGDDSMEGMMYNEPEDMDDQEGNERRPGIRRHEAPEGSHVPPEDYSRQPSTYPPIQGRPPGGIASGNFPPRAFAGPDSSGPMAPGPPPPPPPPAHARTGSTSSLYPPSHGPPVFGQHPVTESPKPLSPGSAQQRQLSQPGPTINRDRSPSMQSHYTPSPFSKSSGALTPPAGSLGLPPSGPQLPPPHGLQPPEARYTLPSQGGPTHPPTQPSGPPTDMRGSGPLSSQSNSLSSHGQSNKGSGETAAFHKDERIWSYVQSLEARMNGMQNEIEKLKAQLTSATQQLQQQR